MTTSTSDRRDRAAPEPGAERDREVSDERAALRADLEALRLPPERKGEGLGTEAPAAAGPPAGRRRRRALLLAAAALVALVAVAAFVLGRGAREVDVARAEPYAEAARTPVPVLSGTGYLVPAQPFVAIGSRVSGRIARYLVDEGDRVHAGDPLVVLEERPFRARLDQAEASLASARARLGLAKAELDRARRLFDDGVLSRDTLDRRESEERVARANVKELEATVRSARIDLEDSVVRAPTDGVVLETYKQPGEVAVPGGFAGSGDLLRLANLSELRAQLDVNESDLPRVRLGQSAEITPDAFPDAHYAGRVVKLAPQIDRQKGTREVEVTVLEPDERLLPDMSVRVVFLASLDPAANGPDAAGGAAGRAVVPRNALRRDDAGRAFVWVVADGRAERRRVEPGETLGDSVVVEGLAGGESVVVGAPPEHDGERVATRP